MDEKIQRFLDGDISVEQLTEVERLEAEHLREAFALISDAASPTHALLPDLAPGVLARIAELEERDAADQQTASGPRVNETAPGRSGLGIIGWLWAPKSIAVRPGFALAAAAALALLIVPVVRTSPGEVTIPGDAAPDESEPTQVFVHFRLDAPGAVSVRLVGDFTDWEPVLELYEVSPGVWTAMVGITPGVHDYAFVVDDGEWVTDPLALEVDDGFGGSNSRLSILPPLGSAQGTRPSTT